MANIIITRADEVEKTLAKRPDIIAVVSIDHAGIKPGELGYAPRISKPEQRIFTFWDTEKRGEDEPPMGIVAETLMFAIQSVKKGPTLIHCSAGKSRSAAIALGVLAALQPEKNEMALLDELLEIRPIAGPNILVVETIDRLLNRGGRLVAATYAHPKISENRARIDEGRQAWINRQNKKNQKKLGM